jgi:tetratricopeptide (TPR) repeat protein
MEVCLQFNFYLNAMDILSSPVPARQRHEVEPQSETPLEESREDLQSEDTGSTERRLIALFEWSLALAMGLAGILFLPWSIAPVTMGKEIALMILLAVAAIAWISHAMTTGTLALARTWWYLPLGILGASAAASTFFSILPQQSIWQVESPAESLAGILVAVASAFLYLNAPEPQRIFKKTLFTLLPISGLLGALNILTLAGVNVWLFDFSRVAGFNPIGSENAFSIFAVFAFIIALNTSKITALGRLRYAAGPIMAILFVNLFLINFQPAWFLLALSVAVIIGIRIAIGHARNIKRIGLLIPLLVVALVFGLIRQRLFASSLQIPLEVSPSRSATLNIAAKVFREGVIRTIFGSGPGMFVYNWEKYRAPEINQTAFWGVRFRQGASGALTSMPTLGILGLGAYLSVMLFALIAAIRRAQVQSPQFISLFSASFGLGAAWFLYPANLTLHLLLFASLGLLLNTTLGKKRVFAFAENPRHAVALSLGLVIFLVGIIAGLYRAGERFISYHQAQKGITAINLSGDAASALPILARAANLAPGETALQRLLAEALLIRLQTLLRQGSQANQQDLQNALGSAIQTAQVATRQNSLDSNNWATLAGIYENIIPFVDGAETFAVEGYKKWQEVSPQNPFPWVAQARASLTAADKFAALANQQGASAQQKKELNDQRIQWLNRAVEALNRAIALKADYADAHFLLAQTLDRQGNLAEAIKKAEQSRQLDPTGVGIAFQLGFLYYKGDRLAEAEQEFQRAISLETNYSNARYFLGLIYDRRSNKQRAIEQFEAIEKLNPQNEEVKRILKNLREGRPALENIAPPAPAPEERRTPPVEETQGKKEQTIE